MKLFVGVWLCFCIAAAGGSPGAAQEETRPSAPGSSPKLPSEVPPQPQQAGTPASAKSKIVYVTDFELDAMDVDGKLEKSVRAIPPSAAPQVDSRGVQSAVERAGRLVDFMSVSLVKELEKAGYTTRRLRPGDTRPSDGIRINGIFGEPDAQNRLRRAVVGAGPGDGKMALFVGIGNLARPDQAWYANADPQSGENAAGTVITVSSYAPVAKFQIEKSITEKAVKDTAAGIVADLSALLTANVVALTQ